VLQRRKILKYLAAGFSLPLWLLRKRSVDAAVAPKTEIPLSVVTDPWSFAEFEFTKQIQTNRGPKPSTFPGYAIRLPQEVAEKSGTKEGLYVVSRICPHEGCDIGYHKDRSEIPRPLPAEVDKFANPMLVCSCHQSMFDPADGGKVIGGPAPRPPWVFEFVVDKGRIVISDLEPGGEKWG
jgi:Rieske Fe-S protein